ncbi:MAG: helix-turn-helix transcriptional regulator [Gammaproteobacteria bacterium]|nr:helix-turn-helix transcriptional regulator [Gammaproteobacteria bacterium]
MEQQTPKSLLTSREKTVLRWAMEGKSAWEIGTILGITERTVKFHFTNIYRKMGVSSRSQAIVQALGKGIVNLGSIA